MNRIFPERILTCDCCASYGMIKQCQLPSCTYQMCIKCRHTYYIKNKHQKCPACRRKINTPWNSIFFIPTYLKKILQIFKNIGIVILKICINLYNQTNINADLLVINLFRLFVILVELFYFFLAICIFRFVYHVHCELFSIESCNHPFFSELFLLYVFVGAIISTIYICIFSCCYHTCCLTNNDDFYIV